MSQLDRDVDHDAIIEDAGAAAGTLQATARMDVRLLVASRTNPREIFDPAKLRDLADSIEILDILEPIIVRKLPAARMAETAHMRPRPTHEIVAGERRYRGALLANLTTVPYVERELTDQQVLDIQLVENLQREDLSPLEEAKGYKRLVDEQGVKAEAIGKSIGRSRAYVYNTIRLLTLTQEARDALLAKTIDRSKAELLATVGDPKLQLKALKEFTESTGWHDRQKSHKECKTWLEQNILLKLKDAPFDTNAEDLLPGCGSCQACPKRTHADRDIFAAFDGPDMCTDPICWQDKDTAHLERIRVRHEAEGCEVIAGKAAKKLKSAYGDEIKGYTRLDAKHDDGDGNLVTIGKLLGKDAPKPVVFVDPVTHKAIKVLPTAVVGAKLKEKGLVKETQAERTAKQEAARAREQAKQRIQEEARARATREIAEKIGAGVVVAFSGGLLRALIVDALTGDYHQDRAPLLELWHLPVSSEDTHDSHNNRKTLFAHIEAAPDERLGVMLLQVLALKRPRDLWYAGDRKELDYLPHLAVDTGVDLQGIEKAVLEEHKQAARAAKEAARAPAGATNEAAPQESIAREGEAPPAAKKPARRPKTKLTAEEAQQGIAYAMQGEESSQAEEQRPEDAAAIAKLRELPHVDDAVAGTLHDAGIEDATDLFDVTSEELSGLTGLEIDQAHALLHAARARILAAEKKPAAAGGGEEILAGATVKILETVKDSRRLRWVGKTGAVLGRIGDRGFDVSFASRGGGRVSFDRSEIEQVQA